MAAGGRPGSARGQKQGLWIISFQHGLQDHPGLLTWYLTASYSSYNTDLRPPRGPCLKQAMSPETSLKSHLWVSVIKTKVHTAVDTRSSFNTAINY